MLNTLKNFKWFFTISIISVLLGVFTFITFINQNFIFLNENNLQYLLILDVTILLIFIILLIKETSRIFSQYKSKQAGSKTGLNYVLQFSLFAFIPSLIVAIFSLILFNVGLQKYFDQKIKSAVNNSYEVARNYIDETKKSVEADVTLVGLDLNRYSGILFLDPKRVQKSIRTQKILRRLDEVYLIDSSGTILLGETNNPENEFTLPTEEEFDLALEGKIVSIGDSGENKTAVMLKLNNFIDTYLYVSRNVQPKLLEYLEDTEQAVNFYYTVENNRTGIKITFAIIYIIVVSMLLFLTIVLAITFAGRLTKPIINLISASKNISSGKLDSKVPNIETDEEIKILNDNFNNMIDRLKKQQQRLLVTERYSAWESVARKLAHEIKNPLTPIQLSADRLKHKYLSSIKKDKEIFINCIDTIIRQVSSIHRMVNDFSTFAKMPRPIFESVKINTLINSFVSMTKLANKEILIKSDLSKTNDIKLRADPNLINQAFNNLIQNSINSINEKNYNNLKDYKGIIDIELTEDKNYCKLIIIDNGKGLPKDKEFLTEPYISRSKKGSGLGLAVVKKIMEDHKGSIELENNANGIGAKVSLLFPIINN